MGMQNKTTMCVKPFYEISEAAAGKTDSTRSRNALSRLKSIPVRVVVDHPDSRNEETEVLPEAPFVGCSLKS